MRLDLLVPTAALLLLSACGSSVTTGTGGGEGSGGAGAAGPSGTGATEAATSTATSASGVPATSGTGGSGGVGNCQSACEHMEMLDCPSDGNCVDECLSSYKETPQCAPQLDAVAICIANLPTCDLELGCKPQLDAYIACVQGGMTGCGPSECSGGGSSGGEMFCTCTAVCNGQEVTSDCASGADGDAKCQCYVQGMVVAACTTPASLMCEVATTCCAEVF